MAFNWNVIIGVIIIIVFVLGIWAKISKQTIGEVITDIKDMLSGRGEEIQERAGEIIEYE
jgi:hypothetical protein